MSQNEKKKLFDLKLDLKIVCRNLNKGEKRIFFIRKWFVKWMKSRGLLKQLPPESGLKLPIFQYTVGYIALSVSPLHASILVACFSGWRHYRCVSFMFASQRTFCFDLKHATMTLGKACRWSISEELLPILGRFASSNTTHFDQLMLTWIFTRWGWIPDV